MQKTISLQWHNRPRYSRRSLKALEDCTGVYNWTVYCFIDRPEDRLVHEKLRGMAEDSGVVDMVISNTIGSMKGAWDRTMGLVFDQYGSDFNFHLEDDVIVGKDILKYGLHCKQFLDEQTKTITCYSHPEKVKSNEDVVHKRVGFTCWGWFGTPDWYYSCYEKAEDQGWDGRAIDIFRHYQKHNLKEIYPEKRRVKNIGIQDGENPREESVFKTAMEEYTGGELEPNPEPTICADCETGQCESAKELNGVRK